MVNITIYSPPTIGVAPIALFIAWISETGPAMRLVPESAIASHPEVQKLDFSPEFTVILKIETNCIGWHDYFMKSWMHSSYNILYS